MFIQLKIEHKSAESVDIGSRRNEVFIFKAGHGKARQGWAWLGMAW